MARFEHKQGLRRERPPAHPELQHLKVIDRAKHLQLQRDAMSKEVARTLLRRTALNRGMGPVRVAQ